MTEQAGDQTSAGFGLTVRWSLHDAPPEVAGKLRQYVVETSMARFWDMSGLRFKVWRMIENEWFEGLYVWSTAAARDSFEASFRERADDSPASLVVGRGPELIEPFEVVAVAGGAEGFVAGPGPGGPS